MVFGRISDFILIAFWSLGHSIPMCCSGLFSGVFFVYFCVEIWTLGAQGSRVSHGEYCKKQLFTELVCYGFRAVCLLLVGSLADILSGFCCSGNKFSEATDREAGGGRC